MLVFRGFGWRHAGRRNWAVRNVDLRIARGERVLLLGPSGAGKSTLLAALAGLLPEDSGEAEGEVEIDGLDPRKARENVGILFQDPQTQLVMARSGDDVAFGLENRGVPAEDIWPRVDEALRRVGFPYGRGRATAELSGGEQQRLALAGVLALRPGLLLLDEPTANLDPAGGALVREAIVRAQDADTTMIIVEHRVAEALPLVDRVVVLEPGGGIRSDGPPSSLAGPIGDRLAADGVWVPGHPLPRFRRASSSGPFVAGPYFVRGTDVAVRDRLAAVSVTGHPEEIVAVTGPNGAGKSTLALTLGGLLAPTSGRVRLAGDDRPPHRWRAPRLARAVGSVFQNPEHQFVTSRVSDEVALGARSRSEVDALLDRLRLAHLAGANPFTLSGGEARRLSVATALASAPRLLILDEPTFGQDRRTWIELVELLADLREAGHGVVAVTHDRAFVTALADRVVTLPGRGAGTDAGMDADAGAGASAGADAGADPGTASAETLCSAYLYAPPPAPEAPPQPDGPLRPEEPQTASRRPDASSQPGASLQADAARRPGAAPKPGSAR